MWTTHHRSFYVLGAHTAPWVTDSTSDVWGARTLVCSGEVFVQHPLHHGGDVTWQGIPRAGVNILLIDNVIGHGSTLEGEWRGEGKERGRGGEREKGRGGEGNNMM